MFNTPVILYLSSRIVAAAGTFFAVALFTRLAGSMEYGHYLLIFAWSSIVYGFASQWMVAAYFGTYQADRTDEYVASLYQLILLAVMVIGAGFIGMSLMGIWEPKFLFAVFVMFVSMTIYYNAFEIARARLKTVAAALSMILRSVLVVALGSLILWQKGTATSLALAVGAAHFAAAIPCWRATGRIQLSAATRDASIHLTKYGWPLIISMGIMASGQSIDRLLLAHFLGPVTLAAYGAVSDMMRQCISVVGEAITFSMITAAKRQLVDGNVNAANATLRTAFNACVAAGAFGAAFFIVFGDLAVRILLAPELHAQTGELIPIFAVTFGIMAVGHYYYLQTIYFTHASFLLPIYSTTMLIVSGVLSAILIPILGPKGAVIGFLTALLIAYAVYIAVSRRYFRMPVDLAGLAEISGLAAMFVLGAWLAGRVVSDTIALQLIEGFVFLSLGMFVVYRYGLLHPISGHVPEKGAELVS
jgi:O-antigen/teichoic acid export membrane protein